MKELSHLAVTPPKAPPPQPKRLPPEARELTFEQLAVGIAPIKAPTEKPPGPAPASASVTERGESRVRFWVERTGGAVQARADDAPTRLARDIEQGRVVPRREIDLHRLSATAARQLLDLEIPRARKDGVLCLLVVCGRGTHSSPDGPVLPDVVIERLSEELAGDVLAFATAPRKWGGLGAILVCLRAAATR